MTKIIPAILTTDKNKFLEGTVLRFHSMFKPIQAVEKTSINPGKESDLASYLFRPIIDSSLETVFAIDATIHMLNALASLAKALYIWTNEQENKKALIDSETMNELSDAYDEVCLAGSAMIAQTLNSFMSFVSWFTRPVASLVQAIDDADQYEYQQSTHSSYS